MNLEFQYFPKNRKLPEHLANVIIALKKTHKNYNSYSYNLSSNDVLKIVSEDLKSLGYLVEASKKTLDKIKVPVLYGKNNKLEKGFDADAVHYEVKTVIEIEAGRAVVNYQFLKNLFQACVMIDIDYLVIAVRLSYRQRNDFEIVCKFIEVIFLNDRLRLPLNGILIIGY